MAGIALLIMAISARGPVPSSPVAVSAMVPGLVCFGGAKAIFFQCALRDLGAARAGSLFSTNPIFGMVVSFAIFPEIPDIYFFAAALLMIPGIWLPATETHSHLHTHPAMVHEHRHRRKDLHHDHAHSPDDPPPDRPGYHSHLHLHEEITHEHPHLPDIHHRHRHR
ncbi:MAG: EamA family transporter [Methanoculleaceae archaeon]